MNQLTSYLRISDILKNFGISRATFWRIRKEKGFPVGTKISDRVQVWKRSDIENWFASQK
jgi:predicted DNA-binding transcriptional regulator AlpA